MARRHQERCEGEGCLVGRGGLVVGGSDAAVLLEAVEAAFHDVATVVELLVEGRRTPATPEPVADLVGPLGTMGDAAPPEPTGDGPGAVALVAWDASGPHTGPTWPDARHPDGLHHRGELGAAVGVADCEGEGERAADALAGEVDFPGQAASGGPGAGAAEPPFRAPADAGGHGRWVQGCKSGRPPTWRVHSPGQTAEAPRSIDAAPVVDEVLREGVGGLAAQRHTVTWIEQVRFAARRWSNPLPRRVASCPH
jgi:hypothetical protein